MPREMAITGCDSQFLTSRGGRDWKRLAEIGRRQHGVVSLAQVVACGFTEAGVASLVQARRLHRVHRGVYALGPAALAREGNWMAAVLACGPGTLLAGLSAGAHHGLISSASALIDVAAPRRIRQPGIRAHALTLVDADRTERLGIPCTSVARTILDIAARRPDVLPPLERAEELGIFDLVALDDVIARNAGHRGVRRLRHGLAAMTAGGPRFRSEFERRLLPITRAAGLPDPLVNHSILLEDGPIEVDCYWPRLRLVVEADGYRFHRGRQEFRRDRRRDRLLAAAGIRCLRFVWEDLALPDRVGRELTRVARCQ
jgi:hypothetical protein